MTGARPSDRPRVLLVEDDVAVRVAVAALLHREGFEVAQVGDGRSGLREAARSAPAIVVLDLMLPDMDGLRVCEEIKAARPELPILILSARGRPDDRVRGLETGADDYLAKPFEPAELAARIRALLRRFARAKGPARLRFGAVEVDLEAAEVRRAGRPVRLSAKEFAVLECLARSPGRALRRETILARVWGPDAPESPRAVDYHVFRLRRKLEPRPARPRYIRTVPGRGYRLDVDAGRSAR